MRGRSEFTMPRQDEEQPSPSRGNRPRWLPRVAACVLGSLFGIAPWILTDVLGLNCSWIPNVIALVWVLPGLVIGGTISGGGFHCVEPSYYFPANGVFYGGMGLLIDYGIHRKRAL